MSAGDLGSVAEFVRLEECSTPSYPIHYLEVWSIGGRWFGLCLHCGRHKGITVGAKPWRHTDHDAAMLQYINPIGGDY